MQEEKEHLRKRKELNNTRRAQEVSEAEQELELKKQRLHARKMKELATTLAREAEEQAISTSSSDKYERILRM